MRLQASEEVCFEAETVQQIEQLEELWRAKVAPVFFEDVPGEQTGAAPRAAATTAAKGTTFDVATATLDELREEHNRRFGKGFYYRPDTIHAGKTREEALRDTLRAEGGAE